MSTATLQEEPAEKDGALSSAASTLERKSLEIENNEKKLEEGSVPDEPEPLSKTRTSLLLMGLTLSIFLVALDFVLPI